MVSARTLTYVLRIDILIYFIKYTHTHTDMLAFTQDIAHWVTLKEGGRLHREIKSEIDDLKCFVATVAGLIGSKYRCYVTYYKIYYIIYNIILYIILK